MPECLHSRLQRQVEAQLAEAGDGQPGVWPAHPLPHVHRREPAGRLGGSPETAAQVSEGSLNLGQHHLVAALLASPSEDQSVSSKESVVTGSEDGPFFVGGCKQRAKYAGDLLLCFRFSFFQ